MKKEPRDHQFSLAKNGSSFLHALEKEIVHFPL